LDLGRFLFEALLLALEHVRGEARRGRRCARVASRSAAAATVTGQQRRDRALRRDLLLQHRRLFLRGAARAARERDSSASARVFCACCRALCRRAW
jgi:hypothetical protein